MAEESLGEETPSDRSYDCVSPRSQGVDEVSSVIISDDEDSQITYVACNASELSGSGPDKDKSQSNNPKRGEEVQANCSWKRDATFFFSFVTFRVEDQLFRVPRDALENQAQYFRDLFVGNAGSSSGDINEPIFLEGIEKDAFRDLLRLLYPPPRTSSFTGPIVLTREQWIKVLDLGQTWGFSGIRAYAIERLQATLLGHVEKLELALKYEIKQWYADAYLALAKRPEPLSIEESQRLGLEVSIKLAQVREHRLLRMIEDPSGGTSVPSRSRGVNSQGRVILFPDGPPTTRLKTTTVRTPADTAPACSSSSNPDPTADMPKECSSPISIPQSPPLQPSNAASAFSTSTPGSSGGAWRKLQVSNTDGSGLNIDHNDARLKQDIKEVFGLDRCVPGPSLRVADNGHTGSCTGYGIGPEIPYSTKLGNSAEIKTKASLGSEGAKSNTNLPLVGDGNACGGDMLSPGTKNSLPSSPGTQMKAVPDSSDATCPGNPGEILSGKDDVSR